MNDSQHNPKELVWKEEYSVGVKEIDEQHKEMFEIINTLLRMLHAVPKEEEVRSVINDLIAYKVVHFATEDKYFHQFNYEGTAEHEAAHERFNQRVAEITEEHKHSAVALAFTLVDYLEDWFIGHIMHADQKYKKCFNDHGLY